MPVLLIITSIIKDFSSKDGTSLSMHAIVMRVGGGGRDGHEMPAIKSMARAIASMPCL